LHARGVPLARALEEEISALAQVGAAMFVLQGKV
jgi:hypothetical protein